MRKRFDNLKAAAAGSLGTEGVGSRMVRGTGWVSVSRLFAQLFGVIQLAVVARFLGPSDIGLIAIVLVVLQVLETFTTPGFTQALIQREGDVSEFLPSVFWVNALRGIVLGTIVLVSSPIVTEFFHRSDALQVVRSSALVILIRGLQSPAIVDISRELRFRQLTVVELSSSATGLITAVFFALAPNNVWALILAMVARELISVIGSYIIAPWRPRLEFELSKVQELYAFGRWVVLGNMVSFISLQLDSIVVGRLLGTTSLGFYEVAFRVSQLPATQISQTAATVAFPALSRLGDRGEQFKVIYLRMTIALLSLNIPITLGLIFFADRIVDIVLGPTWHASVPVLQILAVAGCVRSVITVGGKVFYAAGKPKYDFVLNSVRVVIFASIIYPFVSAEGLQGAAVAVLLSVVSVTPLYFVLIQRSTGISFLDHVDFIGRLGFRAYERLVSRPL